MFSSSNAAATDVNSSQAENKSDASFELNYIEDVIRNGQMLGKGEFGSAYRIGDKVYKIYHDSFNDFDPAERSARYWNQTYKNIYDKKYEKLAIAKRCSMPSRKTKKTYNVLITPYISRITDGFFSGCKLERALAEEASLEMLDCNPSNAIVAQDTLPIDFDLVIPFPRKIGLFGREYDCPSPRSKKLIKEEYGTKCVRFTETVNNQAPALKEEQVALSCRN